jgi:hypothetical protein
LGSTFRSFVPAWVTKISESVSESEAESEAVWVSVLGQAALWGMPAAGLLWGRPIWAWALVHTKQRAVKSSVEMANRRIVKASQENRKSSFEV